MYKLYWSFSYYGPWSYLCKYKTGSKEQALVHAHKLVDNHLAWVKAEYEKTTN